MTWSNRQKQKAERETSDGGRLGCKVTIYVCIYKYICNSYNAPGICGECRFQLSAHTTVEITVAGVRAVVQQ